ncbi:MAG: hypothetical protein KAS07_02025 [Candidatus Pacebacteria bacterium]|nr:hypothetical protein [Candidatus Paceibacterota bacterium]
MNIQKNSNAIIGLASIIILVGIGVLVYKTPSTGVDNDLSAYDVFATCIADSGAKFYGSPWCPACNKQKEDFGESALYLPYVDCAVPNSRVQTTSCKKAEVEAYPTWRFADGAEVKDWLSFEDLAENTGCSFPETKLD